MPKYRVIKQYTCQDEWLVEADDKENALACIWNGHNIIPTPDIRSNIKNHWIEVEEEEDDNKQSS
jgi:hypothetical protein